MGYEKAKRIVKLMRLRKEEKPLRERMFWHEANADLVLELIYAIDNLGGAVMFGTNRPGTSLRIGLYLEDERETHYCDAIEDLAGLLSELIDFYRANGDS